MIYKNIENNPMQRRILGSQVRELDAAAICKDLLQVQQEGSWRNGSPFLAQDSGRLRRIGSENVLPAVG